jgi:hypothetical protein
MDNTTEKRPYRKQTSCFCLWFWRNRYNGIAMFLAIVRLQEAFTPLKIFKNGKHLGGECPSQAHWLGTWQVHFDDESLRIMAWRRLHSVGWVGLLIRSLFCANTINSVYKVFFLVVQLVLMATTSCSRFTTERNRSTRT